jgi:hypothetical protein
MTKFCESCHTANPDRARYCRGCAGKFSGIRTAANVVEGSSPAALPHRAANHDSAAQKSHKGDKGDKGGQHAPPSLSFNVVLLMVALLLWYWALAVEHSPRTEKAAAQGSAVALPTAPVVSVMTAEPMGKTEESLPTSPPSQDRSAEDPRLVEAMQGASR